METRKIITNDLGCRLRAIAGEINCFVHNSKKTKQRMGERRGRKIEIKVGEMRIKRGDTKKNTWDVRVVGRLWEKEGGGGAKKRKTIKDQKETLRDQRRWILFIEKG